MAHSPYPVDPALTAIAIAYMNKSYIADTVLPRIPVNKQEFTWLEYPAGQFFDDVETEVGRRSKPNEVSLEANEFTDACVDQGLDGGVPLSDLANADERYDPLGNEVMLQQQLIALKRERRAASMVFNAANYSAGLKATLAGDTQLNDPDNKTVIATINAALDKALLRPTQMVFGQYGWTQFRALPEIVEACLGTGATKGNATRQAVAELFEVEEVVVGAAFGNANKRGQAANITRLWGKHLALIRKDPVPQAKGAVTFGGTFQWGDRIASQWEDKNIGMRGGIAVRSGESVKERIIASEVGYFFEDAFA
jgi:hypothetical protein